MPLRFNQVLIFRTPSQMAIGGQEYGCFSSNFGGVQPKVCVRDGEETRKEPYLVTVIFRRKAKNLSIVLVFFFFFNLISVVNISSSEHDTAFLCQLYI